MNTYFRKLFAGLAGLLRFNGRTMLHDFWPYAITVVCVLYGISALFGMWMSFDLSQRVLEYARENPGSFDAYNQSIEPAAFEAIMGGVLALVLPAIAIGAGVHIVLLAAAIVRRLHDTGRSGVWALLPLPFGAYGVFAMEKLFARVPVLIGMETPDPVLLAFLCEFIWMIVASLLWLAAVVVLIIMLCGRGNPQPNRFGPPPVAA